MNNQFPNPENYSSKERLPQLDLIAAAILIIVAVTIFVSLTAKLWNFTVDDAFITFRYAENTVKGWGITFNQTPPRAEGYTSILWTLVMVIPHLIGVNAITFAKLMGICFTLSTCGVLAYGLLAISKNELITNRILSAVFAAILFLTFPHVPVHAISGMETSLAAFLYTLTTVLFLKAQINDSPRWTLPLACLFLGLTRPEANLYSALLLGMLWFCLPAPKQREFTVWCIIFYVLPGVVYFFWRYHYYGVLLPLPFYIKSANVGLSGIEPAVSFIEDLAVGFVFPLCMFATSSPSKKALIAIPVMLLFAYFLKVEHIMGYGHRYFFPLVPILSLLSGWGCLIKLKKQETHTRIKIAYLIFITLALVFGSITTLKFVPSYLSYAKGMQRAHILLGQTLATIQWRSDPVLAIGDAGAVPYYSGLKTIDTFGLNDPTIARNFYSDRSNYVLSQDPTLIVLTSKYDNRFDSPFLFENILFQSASKREYSQHVTFVFGSNYYLWVIWRPNSQDSKAFSEALQDAALQSHEIVK